MEASGDPKNREREVAEVGRTAKILAKELNVCIVLLAQLNENGAVRESRTFYMDCDSFTKVSKDEESDDPFAYQFTITHNRHGGTPVIPIRFIKAQARFEEVERMAYSAPIAFCNDVNWLKALLLAQKTVKRYSATSRVNQLLENNNQE
jgi:hypothetical protein